MIVMSWRQKMIEQTGNRITVRDHGPSDLSRLHAWYSDLVVMRFLSYIPARAR